MPAGAGEHGLRRLKTRHSRIQASNQFGKRLPFM